MTVEIPVERVHILQTLCGLLALLKIDYLTNVFQIREANIRMDMNDFSGNHTNW